MAAEGESPLSASAFRKFSAKRYNKGAAMRGLGSTAFVE